MSASDDIVEIQRKIECAWGTVAESWSDEDAALFESEGLGSLQAVLSRVYGCNQMFESYLRSLSSEIDQIDRRIKA